jgi:hypothetical protein
MIAKYLFAGIVSTACFSQHLELGVKGGLPLASALETGSFFRLDFGEGATSGTRRYTIGPLVCALSPYADAGVSFRHLGGVSTTTESFVELPGYGTQTGTSSTFGIDRSNHGGVVGFGLDVRLRVARISPEIRYTRWGADHNFDPQLHSNPNQVSLLVGIAF